MVYVKTENALHNRAQLGERNNAVVVFGLDRFLEWQYTEGTRWEECKHARKGQPHTCSLGWQKHRVMIPRHGELAAWKAKRDARKVIED